MPRWTSKKPFAGNLSIQPTWNSQERSRRGSIEIEIDIFIIQFDDESCSGGDTFGVTREQTWVTDILEVAVEHDHSLKSDTSSTMRVGSVPEAVDVVFQGDGVKPLSNGSLFHKLWVVNSLSSWEDLFTSHEEVVWACIVGIIFTEHGVEGSCWDRISVQHVEVGIVFFFDWIRSILPHSPSFLSTTVSRSSSAGH